MLDRLKTTILMRTLSLTLLACFAVVPTTGCVEEEGDDGGGGAVCGDGVCSFGEAESCSDCATEPDADPGPQPVCGDGICQAGETSACADCAPVNASLRVQNSTSVAIWYLYIAPCGASDWGPDRLGANTIPTGTSFTFTGIPGGCYHLLAHTSAGASGTYWQTPNSGVTLSPSQTYLWTLVD